MEEENKKQDKYLENIDNEIEKVDERINSLMKVKDEALTSAERMDFGIKLMNHKVKLLTLRRSSELSVPECREKALLAVFMSQLRGEVADG
jgi:hypothetical protein